MLDIFAGIVLLIFLGAFAVAACWLSSGCCRYEGYKRKSVKYGRKTKK